MVEKQILDIEVDVSVPLFGVTEEHVAAAEQIAKEVQLRVEEFAATLNARVRACAECNTPFLAESYQTIYCCTRHASRARKRRYRAARAGNGA